MTDTTTLPADLVNALTSLGATERSALADLQGMLPPRLRAAKLICIAAKDGKVKTSDALSLFSIYSGNKVIASAKVQASKIAQFIKAGAAGYGPETIDAVQNFFAGLDDKNRAKFTGSGMTTSGAYEATLKVVRGALDLGHAPSHGEIADMLRPKAKDGDTITSLLESAAKYTDSALGEAPEFKAELQEVAATLKALVLKRAAAIGTKPDATAEANTDRQVKAQVETRAEAAAPLTPEGTSASADAMNTAVAAVEIEDIMLAA